MEKSYDGVRRFALTACVVAAAMTATRAAAFGQPSDRCGDGIRFVIAEPPGWENTLEAFTVVLRQPEHVAHARRLIVEGPAAGSPILYARIEVGRNGVNRDWLAPGYPEWSWHVAEFDHFSDSTAEIFDYWPGGIEEDPQGWVDGGTKGYIGFWTFTVVGELPPACPADFNCDTAISSADFFEFVSMFFAVDGRADFNGDGSVDSTDFFDFLRAFFTEC